MKYASIRLIDRSLDRSIARSINNKMKAKSLRLLIISFFKKDASLSQKDISKLVEMDKAKLSGYLEAMVDYGDLIIKKFGTSKVYSLNKIRKK